MCCTWHSLLDLGFETKCNLISYLFSLSSPPQDSPPGKEVIVKMLKQCTCSSCFYVCRGSLKGTPVQDVGKKKDGNVALDDKPSPQFWQNACCTLFLFRCST
jgi:hypothetical protein